MLRADLSKKLTRPLPTKDGGTLRYPKLHEHLGAAVAIMKLSADWHDFRAKLNKLHPPIGNAKRQAFQTHRAQGLDGGCCPRLNQAGRSHDRPADVVPRDAIFCSPFLISIGR